MSLSLFWESDRTDCDFLSRTQPTRCDGWTSTATRLLSGLFSDFAGAPLTLAREQISSRRGRSFQMNDLRSQLPGSLHQTWPRLIINDSGGQCPIFTAESSVMPGQAKPPEFHHFQVLFTLKKQKRSPQLFNNGYLGGWKNSWNVITKWGTIYLFLV